MAIDSRWWSATIHKIGDDNGLMVVEVQGKDLEDAKQRLSSVLDIKTCYIQDDAWSEI